MSRNGFTLAEILVVIAIVCVLAALGFSMGASARESSRQASCISQLKSTYGSLVLYAADWDEGNHYPELHGLTYVGRGRNVADVLEPYGFAADHRFCPSSTIRMRERLATSYMWTIRTSPTEPDGSMSPTRREVIRMEKILGIATPAIECHIHDEVFYAPAEEHIDFQVATPFRIHLRLDGSVKKGRFWPHRTFIFTDMSYWGQDEGRRSLSARGANPYGSPDDRQSD